jgi:hypothetical protein
MTPAGFARMLERVSVEAGFGWKVHPHMLRHESGYKLANDARDTRTIQDHLGHRSIQSTVRYTELASVRFVGLWQDWVVGHVWMAARKDFLRVMSRSCRLRSCVELQPERDVKCQIHRSPQP